MNASFVKQKQHGLWLALVAILFFLVIGLLVKQTTYFTHINHVVFSNLQLIRSPMLDGVFTAITSLGGGGTFMHIALIPVLIWLLYYRHLFIIVHLYLSLIMARWLTAQLKILFAFERPSHGLIELGFAYPSGHAALGFTFFIFMAWLLTQTYKGFPKYCLFLLYCSPAILVGISRLYLGVHWLTDIIGGLLLAIVINSLNIWLYRRYHTYHVRPNHWLTICVLCSTLLAAIVIAKNLNHEITIYQALTVPLKAKALTMHP